MIEIKLSKKRIDELYELFHSTLSELREIIYSDYEEYYEQKYLQEISYNVLILRELVEKFNLTEKEFKRLVFWNSYKERENEIIM